MLKQKRVLPSSAARTVSDEPQFDDEGKAEEVRRLATEHRKPLGAVVTSLLLRRALAHKQFVSMATHLRKKIFSISS